MEGAVDEYVKAMHASLATAANAATSTKSDAASAQTSLHASVRATPTYAAESTIVEDEEMHMAHAAASQAALAFFKSRAVQDADKTPPFEVSLPVFVISLP